VVRGNEWDKSQREPNTNNDEQETPERGVARRGYFTRLLLGELEAASLEL
jgi:hypothetical protein